MWPTTAILVLLASHHMVLATLPVSWFSVNSSCGQGDYPQSGNLGYRLIVPSTQLTFHVQMF